MGAFAVICGSLFFLLPETHKKVMPDTVQQVDSASVDRANGEYSMDQDEQNTAL